MATNKSDAGRVRLVWQPLVHEVDGDTTLCGKPLGTMQPYKTVDIGAATCHECLGKSKAREKKAKG